MKRTWVEKGYWGSGSYHGDFLCENPDCPHNKNLEAAEYLPNFRRPIKSQMFFSHWEPEQGDNQHPVVFGYCCKNCLEECEI